MQQKTKSRLFKALKSNLSGLRSIDQKFYLVLDDDDIFLMDIERRANGTAKTLRTFSCQDEFSKAFRAYPNAVLVLDIMQPVKDGIALAEELGLANFENQIVFVSGTEPSPEKLKRIEGMNAEFLIKDDVSTQRISEQKL